MAGWLVVEDQFASVVGGEGEIALAMAESILRRLDATPEQIDHERERLRADLSDGVSTAESLKPQNEKCT